MMLAPKGRNTPSIGHLPNELLIIVFKLVHQASREESLCTPSADDPYNKHWYSRQELISPARFPDALARVCLLWRTTMSSVPTFWTDVVVVVDTFSQEPFSLPDVQSVLEWTRGLPLNITVTRQPGSPIPSLLDEQSMLLPLINLLAPQIHRCQSFAFYATHSSALPLLGRDIYGSTPLLKGLKLECEVDDGTAGVPDCGWRSFSCPSLFSLVINGLNFVNVTRHDYKWLTELPELRWATFSRLAPHAENDTFETHMSFSRFMRMLADMELEYLRICDFDPGNYDLDSSEEFNIALAVGNRLDLEDLTKAFIREFSRAITLYTDELHISRCSLTSMEAIPSTESLTLEDISQDDDLAIRLRKWRGSVLTLSRCPGFDDRVLNMLGDPDVLQDFGNSPDSLVKLILIDCPNFSIEAIKGMLEGRNEDVEGVLEYYGPPVIEGIRVYGKGPFLSYEDVGWFKEKLRYLDWHTEQRDGVSSRVEFDAEEQDSDLD